MKNFMTVEELEAEASNERTTANQLDILVTSARELVTYREREIEKVNSILDKLEKDLEKDSLL